MVYNGSAESADGNTGRDAVEGAEPAASGDGYDLSFENAPVTTVAKVILGDILGVGYIIDPRVQGTVTLSSGRPVAKSDVLYVLESALRVSNVALVRDTDGYRLVPVNEAIASGRLDVAADGRTPQAGYGVSVVPLRYVSAATITKLLENFATKQGAIRVDAARNMILIQGTGPERRTAVETVLSFDTDWMRGQTVGIFPVHHSTPEPIISEIEKIMDTGDGGLNQDLIKLQPIARLNAILVATNKPALAEDRAELDSPARQFGNFEHRRESLSRPLRRREASRGNPERNVRRRLVRHLDRLGVKPDCAGRRRDDHVERLRSRRADDPGRAAHRRSAAEQTAWPPINPAAPPPVRLR